MAKQPMFSPHAILFRHPFKTETGLVQLVGTDPGEEDLSKVYLWPDAAGGWEIRQAYALAKEGLQHAHNNCGKTSGWPGATPVEQEKRPVGRPPGSAKELASREVIRVPLERDLALKAMQCAALDQKMLPQWIKSLVEAAVLKTDGAQ